MGINALAFYYKFIIRNNKSERITNYGQMVQIILLWYGTIVYNKLENIIAFAADTYIFLPYES